MDLHGRVIVHVHTHLPENGLEWADSRMSVLGERFGKVAMHPSLTITRQRMAKSRRKR